VLGKVEQSQDVSFFIELTITLMMLISRFNDSKTVEKSCLEVNLDSGK
jgi:hypothetical protein